MNFSTQQNQKFVFDQARTALQAAGLDEKAVAAAALTQSFIRLEILLTSTATGYSLPVLVNDTTNGNVRKTEQRLNLQDAFYGSEFNMYIAKASGPTDYTFVPTTYPNSVTFPTGAASLGALYNGKMSIAVNNVVILPAYDLLQFRVAPVTQLTAATNSPIDEFQGSDKTVLQPNIVFIGSKNTQVVVTLPQAITTIDANTYLILEWRGVLAQNVTVVS